MNDYVNKMLDAALKKNMDTFQNAFRSGVIDKIDTQLQTKRDEISFDSMKYVESTDDVVKESIKPSNYHFKNSSAAKKFVSAITKMGVEKKKFHIKNDTVSISGLDKDTNELVSHLSKDMKAVREDVDFHSILDSVTSSGIEKEVMLRDGNIVVLDEDSAFLLVRLHNSLHNNNRTSMENNIFESQEVYDNVLNFAKENKDDFK